MLAVGLRSFEALTLTLTLTLSLTLSTVRLSLVKRVPPPSSTSERYLKKV